MRYNKPPLDFPDQISLLKERGMTFTDERQATDSLSSISYSRLASYWTNHLHRKSTEFKDGTRFEDILKIYTFDQQLRSIIFSSIQSIEIAFRTRLSHYSSMQYGAFWFADPKIFKEIAIYNVCLEKLNEEITRSHEDFISEHIEKYHEPPFPPSWKTMEVASFGSLSKLYSNISDAELKKVISRSFKLPSYLFLENWMKCASVLRNCCAHHARLWNRRFSVIPKYPPNLPGKWITAPLRRPEKLYGQLCCLAYMEQSIQPNSSLKRNILRLMESSPEIDLHAMGFPTDWQQQPLWDN